MIKRFVFGTPFPTESVVLDLPVETGPVPFLTPDGDGWTYTMQEKDIVYGLGEMPRGLNKRGWHYETNNTDESEHGENRLSYYAAHNFLLISSADGSLTPTLPCWTAPPSPSGVLRRTVSLCPTGCTPTTASPPTLISPTTGASSGNKNPRTQPSALPLLQRDAAKLLRHGATKSS